MGIILSFIKGIFSYEVKVIKKPRIKNLEKINNKLKEYIKICQKPIKYERINTDFCVICLEEWENTDNIQLWPKCKHYFHKKCINGLKNNLCPLCKSSFDLDF